MEKRARFFDICILCALYEEAEAVRNEFEDRCQEIWFQSAFTKKKKYPYWHATLKNLREEALTVLVMAMPFTGPVETPIFVHSLLDEFRPRFIAMTGICAGDHNVAIGDLVVASYAFHHDAGKIETGKEGQDFLRPEWRTAGPQSHIVMYAQALTTWKRPLIEMKQCLLGRDLLPEEHPQCLIAPMASGMAVQGNYPFPRLQEHNRKIEFLDQEVAAFYRTLQELPEVHFLAVKSVCDNGDPAKNDTYHTYAARASAVYLLYFIQEYVNEETMPEHNDPPASDRVGPPVWNDLAAAFENVAQGRRKVVEDLKPLPLPKPLRQRWSRRTFVLGLVGIVAGSSLTYLAVSHPLHSPAPSTKLLNFDPSMKGKWAVTGSILQGRFGFRATTLKNGKVLIEGGNNAIGDFLAESELFNISTDTWTKTGSLNVARFEHTATLLQDGRVLAVGGFAGPVLASAELYDPVGGTWIPSDSLSEKRTRHTATLLKDGKVLVAGGWGRYGVPIDSAEIYDPDAGSWSSAGKMRITRSDHIAVLLEDGKILVAGGAPENEACTAQAEVYDPTTNIWAPTGSLNIPRCYFTALLLPSGKVLAIGGNTPTGSTATVELYDPATRRWSLTGGMKHPRAGFLDTSALLLTDGTVLIADGDSSSTSEIYMLGQGTWTALANIGQLHHDGATALLNDGRALIVGGRDGSSSGLTLSTAIYTPD